MFEISDLIRYFVQAKNLLTDGCHPVNNFVMIDNIFYSVYFAAHINDEILCLLPLLGLIVRYTG